MAYYRSRGLRGSALEEYINLTNVKYREHQLGLIQKIPTPIKPVELDSVNGNIKKAFFEERSTVDYIGLVQGYPICFDAKETKLKRFPLKNIHHHQIDFMKDFEKQEGIAFFLIHFSSEDTIFFVPFTFIENKIAQSNEGGPKSIPYEEFTNFYQVHNKDGYIVHYIDALDRFLQET
jgi:recombination protein U